VLKNTTVVWILIAVALAAVGCGGSLAAGPRQPMGDAARGRALFSQQTVRDTPGCVTCHSVEPNVVVVGPSLAGIGTTAERIVKSPGYTGTAKTGEEFLRESILNPNANVGAGFSHGVMPDWLTVLSEQQIADLLAYLEKLR
jgi:cytochrome c553